MNRTTDSDIEDLEALERELFDCIEAAENGRSIRLLVPLGPDRPYHIGQCQALVAHCL